MHIHQIAAGMVCCYLAACQPTAPTALSDGDKAAIEATSQTFLKAAQASDWAGVAATYTEDAVLMPPNGPAVQGRDDIQAFWESFPPVADLDLANVEIAGRGDLAYVRGTYKLKIVLEGHDPVPDTGKYIEIRKKQADGS